jgi:predicted LPLAT superfamily acyltransferase
MPKPPAPDNQTAPPPVPQRGNRLGFLLFQLAARCCGLRGAYGLLYLVCPYYLLFDRAARRATWAYLRRRFPAQNGWRRLGCAYRLLISQGRSLIDRYAMLAGAMRFDIILNGYEQVADLVADSRQGFVLLTAHVGNWQMILTAVERFGRRVCLLMRPEDNPAVQQALRLNRASGAVSIVSPDTFLSGMPELLRRLSAGTIVSLMGDRSYGARTLAVDFLGERAFLPYGAFLIAAAMGCPVVVMLSAKLGVRTYRVDIVQVTRPRYQPGLDKQSQLQVWVQEFARTLERYSRDYPLQYFVFEDVWRPRPG